jgi:queuine tRNA-ribosyltransferase
MASLDFHIESEDKSSKARAGRLMTAHGEVRTPIFMPVGTTGTVKAVTNRQLREDIRAQIILGNTYHLYLRPGLETIGDAGGLHKFIAWDGPILTDSGGYQVFSLSGKRKITDEGVMFQSHIDGSKHLFTPEKVVDIQRTIGADIMMAFDECPPHEAGYEYVKIPCTTHRWLLKCFHQFKIQGKIRVFTIFVPIVQGSIFEDLRKNPAILFLQ